jgi:asparagine synthase (glutamine-hydrolysing)
MAVGLEVRAPFLDVELVEWLAGLPTSWKVRGSCGKYLLRRAFAKTLPAAALRRRKQGFALPVGRWFHGPLRELLGDLLSPGRLGRSGLWNAPRVRQVLEAHWARRANHGALLWALLVFELWRDQVLCRADAGACEVPSR